MHIYNGVNKRQHSRKKSKNTIEGCVPWKKESEVEKMRTKWDLKASSILLVVVELHAVFEACGVNVKLNN